MRANDVKSLSFFFFISHSIYFHYLLSFLSPPLVLRVPQSRQLCFADCSSYSRSCYLLRQIPSLHLQTHTGCTCASHAGTVHKYAHIK